MKNYDVKEYARRHGVFLYEVAHKLGVSEPTLTRWLRLEVSENRKSAIMNAIDELAAEKRAAVAVN